ncbi:endoribonuclease ZC3H12A-like [Actinia tenebrosa]|uniref:Endoribonuclease ZC3H12A-like n=1 Tax=Actinia tenebrosa TaxID=6105 RepID=A0A6P8GZC0_ACTTE|nr:endoribonuclease ZC3H12A-like [Actinia tenebrosa]
MADIRDIAVDQDKKKAVSDAIERINQLFNVQVSLSPTEAVGFQWVQLKGRIEDIENAKNYINSLCKPEIEDVKVSIPEEYFDAISEYRNHVEKTSGAVVLFSSPKEACIQGSEMSVVIATSAIEERINELRAGVNGLPRLMSSGSISPQQKLEQEKVQSTPVPYIDPSLEEFAIKLGYSKEDIHQVVKKQGKEVDQNTLLRELIKVSSPSLLQRAKPEYAAHPGLSKPVSHNKDEVVARGTSNRAAIPQSRNEEIVARGAMCPPGQRPFPMESTSSQGVFLPFDRQYLNDRPEDDTLMYQQVIGNSSATVDSNSDLRHIVIDGSNVAMSHGNQQYFSCMGIKICVDYFKKRGHKEITVFVPQWRKEYPKPDAPIKNQEILTELEADRHLVFTPSRRVNGRRIVCYDDRFILKLANDTDGIVVSNDHFRDLFNESPQWQEVIEQRILMYSFVNDILMVPDDPLGRHGPKLDDFLRKGTATHRRVCPYLRRCTYGLRCKYYHPERDHSRKGAEARTFARPEVPRQDYTTEQYHRSMNATSNYPALPVAQHSGNRRFVDGPIDRERHVNSANIERNDFDGARSATFQRLLAVFPEERQELILQVMRDNPHADLNYLAELIVTRSNS